MSNENMFEIAARKKYRFPYKGLVSTEDLWDLSVQSLDLVFKSLNAAAKKYQEESLLKTRDEQEEILARKIEIVKDIVAVKQEEIEAMKLAQEKKAQKQRILEIIARKEDDALQNMSLEELQKMAEDL